MSYQGNRPRGTHWRPPSPTPSPPQSSLDQFWPGYLNDGYFEGGNLRPELVSRDKMDALAHEMANDRPGLTKHQLRRFFNHCRAIEARLKSGASTWEAERANFLKLDIAAAAAAPSPDRNDPKIPRLFHDFIKRNVQAVRTETDFLKGFLPHFEALVGFGQAHFKQQDRR